MNVRESAQPVTPHLHSKEHFLALDGMRGIAACVVLIYHRRGYLGHGLAEHGYLAVDFFFILSGFVISHAYGGRLTDSSMSFWQFFRARAIRLGPLVMLGALMVAFVELMVVVNGGDLDTFSWVRRQGNPTTLSSYLITLPLAMLALPNPWLGNPFGINEPRWSLFFEMVANLAFALVAPWLTNRRLAWVLSLLTIGLSVAVLANPVSQATHAGVVLGETGLRNVYLTGLLRVTASFLAGVALQRLWAVQRLPKIRAPFWLLATILVAILFAPVFGDNTEAAYVLISCVIAFPIIIIIGCQCSLSPIFKWIATWSAALSFPLYILHLPMLECFDFLHGKDPARTHVWLLTELAVCCALALAIGRYFDRPIRSWLSSRWSGSDAEARQPAPPAAGD
ncbi:MAG: acyltransferase [Novosphingobium sp.]